MTEIKLKDLFRLLKENILLIIGLSFVVGILVSTSYNLLMPKKYESDAKIIFKLDNKNSEEVNDKIINTYKEIMKSRETCKLVIDDLNLDYNVGEFRENVSIDIINKTNVLSIKSKYKDSQKSADIANHLGDVAINKFIEFTGAKNVEFLDKAIANKNPQGPSFIRNFILSSMLGFFISLLYLVFFKGFENKTSSKEQIEEIFGIDVIVSLSKYSGEFDD